ncbi:MAG: polyribonucleotide nucleotidyltransferase [Patescibacteria group bacterium]|nr:MAG: polyribonucleotide nucleotidyltransferase [Patescibacteria group bacterium]
MTKQYSLEWGGKTLSVEIGKLAKQANGSCVVRYGDTMVLVTATMSSGSRDGIDFLPLSVECEERLYAAGKIKSSRFLKREGRPTDDAVVVGRMIDRSIRPLFNQKIRNEIQVVFTTLAFDKENDYDIPAMVGASIALGMSDIPWDGPVGGIRVGRVGSEWVINPSYEAREKSDIDVVIVGTPTHTTMVEAESNEAKEEDVMAGMRFGAKHLSEVQAFIEKIVAEIGKPKRSVNELIGLDEETAKEKEALIAKSREFIFPKIREYLFATPKATKGERRDAKVALAHTLDEYLKAEQVGKDKRKWALDAMQKWVEEVVSQIILDEGKRCDGRALDEIRELSAEVALLPRVHGSGLFSRGETQILSTVTLGAPSDVQLVDSMEFSEKRRYFHHYNFPPYSVGETGRFGGGGRREIGHGGLAERALVPVLPSKEDFPYTIRVVSETLGSNGSSSQGSICGSTLALMDAGVPIKKPVAGIAMGIATDPNDVNRYKIITDLQDLEDGMGGMDFKIGGTRDGITSIQMDTKTKGLTWQIVEETLTKAKAARLQILDVMAQAIAAPRPDLSPYAPRIVVLKINPDLIRNVIGPGGKTINAIIEKTGVQMDVENDGTVTITSVNLEQLQAAKRWVEDLTRELKVGEFFEAGKVTRILDFGAFVEVLPGQEGMVHISELDSKRVEKVTDVVKVGDIIPVVVIKIDELGRVNLSLKRAKEKLQQNGGSDAPKTA